MLWTICSKNITCKITYNHSACEEHNNPGALVFGFWWNAILVFLPLSSRQIIIWIAAIPSFVLWSHQKSLSTSLGRLDGEVKHHWDLPEVMLVPVPLLPLASEIIIGIAGSEELWVSGRRGTQGCCWHTQKHPEQWFLQSVAASKALSVPAASDTARCHCSDHEGLWRPHPGAGAWFWGRTGHAAIAPCCSCCCGSHPWLERNIEAQFILSHRKCLPVCKIINSVFYRSVYLPN